jgi:hypothetical protein
MLLIFIIDEILRLILYIIKIFKTVNKDIYIRYKKGKDLIFYILLE